MGSYSVVTDQSALEQALPLARGSYQRSILYGTEALSGATIRGKAKQYSGRYAVSRYHLLLRLDAAGVEWTEMRGPHNRRILVLGPMPVDPRAELTAA